MKNKEILEYCKIYLKRCRNQIKHYPQKSYLSGKIKALEDIIEIITTDDKQRMDYQTKK